MSSTNLSSVSVYLYFCDCESERAINIKRELVVAPGVTGKSKGKDLVSVVIKRFPTPADVVLPLNIKNEAVTKMSWGKTIFPGSGHRFVYVSTGV